MPCWQICASYLITLDTTVHLLNQIAFQSLVLDRVLRMFAANYACGQAINPLPLG